MVTAGEGTPPYEFALPNVFGTRVSPLPMKRFFLVVVLAIAAGISRDVRAGGTLFERSYYSHAPAKPVVIGHRAPVGGPQFTRPQGIAATSGYRWQRSQIQVNGRVVDQLNIWDSWIQLQGKY